MPDWFVYIVDKAGRYYVGVTTDLDNRLRQHGRPPLLYVEGPLARDEAIQREKELKGWSREKKSALIDQFRASCRGVSLS